MAAMMGGHTYFMQNTTKQTNAIICPISVRLIFTPFSSQINGGRPMRDPVSEILLD
jgi:hypothetical protein